MNIGEIFSILFIVPITNALVVFYKLLLTIGLPSALGFAIIALTVFIRLLLIPFVTAQTKAASKMQKLAPHMAQLREKHKDDKKKQQEELLRLYKEHGVNPASGCLPALVQIPIVWSLYSVLTEMVKVNSHAALTTINNKLYFSFLKIERVPESAFLGASLSAIPSDLISKNPLILLVPVATGLFQFILSAMMVPHDKQEVQNKKENKSNQEDFQKAFQTQSLFLLPIMVGFFSYTLPIGLSLYWNTFTIFGILQQYFVAGPGKLAFFKESVQKRIWKKTK